MQTALFAQRLICRLQQIVMTAPQERVAGHEDKRGIDEDRR
jgi:hypothetical protein